MQEMALNGDAKLSTENQRRQSESLKFCKCLIPLDK
jgi:hypothetical protein